MTGFVQTVSAHDLKKDGIARQDKEAVMSKENSAFELRTYTLTALMRTTCSVSASMI